MKHLFAILIIAAVALFGWLLLKKSGTSPTGDTKPKTAADTTTGTAKTGDEWGDRLSGAGDLLKGFGELAKGFGWGGGGSEGEGDSGEGLA
jgi:hypothetical protein